MKKKLIIFLASLFVFLTLSLIAEAQNTGSPHVRQHVKLQAYYSYETRERVATKRERIYVRIEELKNN